MCGRYALTVMISDLQDLLPGFEVRASLAPRYNVAPTQVMPVAFNDAKVVDGARWGLIPRWAKDESIGSRMINARAETLAEKPSFRDSYKKRRCAVPATGFYEWRAEPGKKVKTPFHIRRPGGKPFAFAGLWDVWRSPEGPLRSFTIITTAASASVSAVHDRMPVILPPEALAAWLSPEPREPDALAGLLVPFSGALELVEVSTRVNNPRHDAPDCLEA